MNGHYTTISSKALYFVRHPRILQSWHILSKEIKMESNTIFIKSHFLDIEI